MSGALDTLTPEEQAELDQMRRDDNSGAPPPPKGQEEPEVAATEPEPQKGVQEPTHAPESQPAMVDKRALDEERDRRRKMAQELEEVKRAAAAERARIEERLRLLTEVAQSHVAPKAEEPPEPPAPDFSVDPAGFFKHSFEQLSRHQQKIAERLAKVESGATEQTQRQQQDQAVQELQQWAIAQENEFARETPDYQAAMQYLHNVRAESLRTLGETDPAVIQRTIRNDVLQAANNARQRGKNLGEMLYTIAKHNGYRAAEPASASATEVAPTSASTTAAERLVRGRDMATTLGTTGNAPRGELAPQHLVDMSEKEFEDFLGKIKKDKNAMMHYFGA